MAISGIVQAVHERTRWGNILVQWRHHIVRDLLSPRKGPDQPPQSLIILQDWACDLLDFYSDSDLVLPGKSLFALFWTTGRERLLYCGLVVKRDTRDSNAYQRIGYLKAFPRITVLEPWAYEQKADTVLV